MSGSQLFRAARLPDGMRRQAAFTLALISVLLLPLASAQAADPAPLRVIGDPNPSFGGVWVDTVNDEIVVSDDNRHSVRVYARTASGPASPLREIRGEYTGIVFPASVVVDVANNEIWTTMNDTAERAVVHPRTANGDAPPLRILDFSVLTPGRFPRNRSWGWAVDAKNDEVIAVFQRQPGAVAVFDRVTGEGKRQIRGPAALFADPHGLSLDEVHGEYFVTNEGHLPGAAPVAPAISVYPRTASGNASPVRRVQGPSTRLSMPKHIHVDPANGEMAVANGGNDSITIYDRAADGDVAPLRTIAGALTGLADPTGAFIDTTHDEILVANWGNHAITVYPRLANGNVAPLRVITAGSGPKVGIGKPAALAFDPVNDEIGVYSCVSHPGLAIFDRLADGQAAPKRVIYGPDTRISRSVHGLWIDAVNDEIVVPSEQELAILVFDRFASGNVPPKRVIQGPSTGIEAATRGVMVDTVNDEIVMPSGDDAATGFRKMAVWDRLAEGDAPPKREFVAPQLGRGAAVGIWVDAVHDEIYWVADGIYVFDRLATGTAVAKRAIVGPSTEMVSSQQMALDLVNDEIVVVNEGDEESIPNIYGSLTVYDRLAEGDVPPKRMIRHVERSFLQNPHSMYVDPINDEIGVGESNRNEIRIYPRVW